MEAITGRNSVRDRSDQASVRSIERPRPAKRGEGDAPRSGVPVRGLATMTAAIGAVVTFIPQLTYACATCFGAPDSNLSKGAANGVWFMLGIIGFVQLGFVALFYSFWRRARALRRRRESFRVVEGGLL